MSIESLNFAVNKGIIDPTYHATHVESADEAMMLEQISRQYPLINFTTIRTMLNEQRLTLGLTEDDDDTVRRLQQYLCRTFAATVPHNLLISERAKPFTPVKLDCPYKLQYDENWIQQSRERIERNLRTIFALPDTSQAPDEHHQ
ncbi:MAG: hypothetical protein ABL890_03075 [Candidatus Peribacteraceae bacterium]